MLALLKKQKLKTIQKIWYVPVLKAVDGSLLPSSMINPDSEKISKNHMWLMATKTKVLIFHYLSFVVIMVCYNAQIWKLSIIYNHRRVVDMVSRGLLPKTEKCSTCYFPYLSSILILLFQVVMAQTAAQQKIFWKKILLFC